MPLAVGCSACAFARASAFSASSACAFSRALRISPIFRISSSISAQTLCPAWFDEAPPPPPRRPPRSGLSGRCSLRGGSSSPPATRAALFSFCLRTCTSYSDMMRWPPGVSSGWPCISIGTVEKPSLGRNSWNSGLYRPDLSCTMMNGWRASLMKFLAIRPPPPPTSGTPRAVGCDMCATPPSVWEVFSGHPAGVVCGSDRVLARNLARALPCIACVCSLLGGALKRFAHPKCV